MRAATVLRAAGHRRPGELAQIARRELGYAVSGRSAEARLRLAARRGEPIVAGPFLGEVGFELLYWIPFLRRLLGDLRVPRERVTVVTRGGAGAWYGDLAASTVELYDLVGPADLRVRLVGRRESAGDAKQLTVESLDRELAALVLATTGPAAVVHPLLMYTRLRPVWAEWRPLPAGLDRLDLRPLPQPDPPPAELPAEYVAVKAYFSDCFPSTPATHAALAEIVGGLAARSEVVLLTNGLSLDDHVEWRTEGDGVHVLDGACAPRDNLAVQTRVVAGAQALVSTYGGFSYLGPLLRVPTTALHANREFNPTHLATLRASGLADDYELVDVTAPVEALA